MDLEWWIGLAFLLTALCALVLCALAVVVDGGFLVVAAMMVGAHLLAWRALRRPR